MPVDVNKDINEALMNDILMIYSDAEDKLLATVAKRVAKGITEEGWNEKKLKNTQLLKKEIEKVLSSTSKLSKAKISKGIIDAYKQGFAGVGGQKGTHGTILDELDIPMNLKMQVLATNKLLDNATFQVLRKANDAYQEVMAHANTGLLSGVDTRIQASQKMLNEFASKGITSFVDKAGRNWDLSSYAEMCARTVGSHASLQGHIDRQIEVGEDLVKVSTIGTTCPICMRWQGVVLSISGNSPKYHSVEEAKASGLFHPNCKHTLVMYIPELDDGTEHEGKVEPMSQEDANKQYGVHRNKLIEKQRANERNIRYWKKRKALAITKEEQAKCDEKIKYWQYKNLLHCEKNRLRRQYAREGVMSGNAKGPMGTFIGGSLKEFEQMYDDVVGENPEKVFSELSAYDKFVDSIKLTSFNDGLKELLIGAYKNASEDDLSLFQKVWENMSIDESYGSTGFDITSGSFKFSKSMIKDKGYAYVTIPHEAFHAIDYSPESGETLKFKSARFKLSNGSKVSTTCAGKRSSIIDNSSLIKKDIKKLVKNSDERVLINDFFDNLTIGKAGFPGHGEDYYKGTPSGTWVSEAFANYCSMRINECKNSLGIVDKYFPEFSDMYDEFIQSQYKEQGISFKAKGKSLYNKITMTAKYEKWLKDEITSLDELDIDKAMMKDANNKNVTPTSLYKKYIGDNPGQDYASISEYEKGTKEYKSGYAKWLKTQIDEIGVSYKVKPKYVEVHEDIPDEDTKLSATEIYKKYHDGEKPTEAYKKLGGEEGTGIKYGKWVENQKKELIKNGITKTVPFSNTATQKNVNTISQASQTIEKAKDTIKKAELENYKKMLDSSVHGQYDAYLKVKEQFEEYKTNSDDPIVHEKMMMAKEKHLEMVKKKAEKEFGWGTGAFEQSIKNLEDMKAKESNLFMKNHIQAQIDEYEKVKKANDPLAKYNKVPDWALDDYLKAMKDGNNEHLKNEKDYLVYTLGQHTSDWEKYEEVNQKIQAIEEAQQGTLGMTEKEKEAFLKKKKEDEEAAKKKLEQAIKSGKVSIGREVSFKEGKLVERSKMYNELSLEDLEKLSDQVVGHNLFSNSNRRDILGRDRVDGHNHHMGHKVELKSGLTQEQKELGKAFQIAYNDYFNTIKCQDINLAYLNGYENASQEMKKKIDAIKKAIHSVELSEPVVLHRFTTPEVMKSIFKTLDFDSIEESEVFDNDTFISAATGGHPTFGKRNYKITIQVDKGTHALPSLNHEELEVLLDKGKFEFVKSNKYGVGSGTTVLSKDDFDKYVKENGLTTIYRGYSAESNDELEKRVRELETGSSSMSGSKSSALGEGVYFAKTKKEAKEYMERRKSESNHKYGEITEIALKKGSKIAIQNDLSISKNEEIEKMSNELFELDMNSEEFKVKKEKYDKIRKMTISEYARHKGYDAMYDTGTQYTVVVNQDKMIVKGHKDSKVQQLSQRLQNYDGSYTDFVGEEVVVRYIEDGRTEEYEVPTTEKIDKFLGVKNVEHHTKESKDWIKSLSKDERKASDRYTGSWYTEMNNVYRRNDRSDKNVVKLSEDLTTALRRAETEKPVVLRRGIYESDLAHMLGFNGDYSKVKSNWDKINSGDYAAEDKGFLSTSPYSKGGFTSKPVELRIYCPKGTHAAYVDSISTHRGEQETLLQSGSMYRVIELKKEGGKIIAYLELLGTD